jgi:ribonuclease Z
MEEVKEMCEIVILGSANAVPKEEAENTHFLVKQKQRVILIDCASSPMVRIPKAGVTFDQIDDIILTHFHPDHVAGIPLLLMDLWLLGRRKPINIYGLQYTLDRLMTMMELFDYQNWPDFYSLNLKTIEPVEKTLVFETEKLRIFASPVRHLIPNIGLRFDCFDEGSSFAYSSDTAPCAEMVSLAMGCDLLLHEASGNSPGHTSAAQAAEIARQAEVKSLYLIHYPTDERQHKQMVEDARAIFPGFVALAKDFMHLSLPTNHR